LAVLGMMNTTTKSRPLRPKPKFDDVVIPEGPNQLPVKDLKRLSHGQLVQRCVDMHIWQNKLLSTINSLQSQNKYWTNLYGFVELGLTKKLSEMEALRLENKQLRVQLDLEHVLTVKENHRPSVSADKDSIDPNHLPPQTALRIQQLEDQVRARDLVIELLFARVTSSDLTERDKRQEEKSDEKMQKKLEFYRRRLESEFGLSEKGAPEEQGEAERERNTENTGKRSRETDELQDSASEGVLKRPKTVGNNARLEGEIDSGPGVLKGNGELNVTSGQVDDAVLVEQAIQEAFDELGQDFVDDELEDLFTE